MRPAHVLLAGGVAVPFHYFANLIVAEAMTPGFNPWSQLPSELGLAGLPFAPVFNAGLIAVGAATVSGGVGLLLGLRHLGTHVVLAALTGLSLALAGVAMAMSGIFPLPNPLHYGFNLLLAGIFAPLLGGIALGAAKDAGRERLVLVAAFALIVVLYLVILLVSGIVDRSNQGLWVRGLGLLSFSTIAYLCWAVMRRI